MWFNKSYYEEDIETRIEGLIWELEHQALNNKDHEIMFRASAMKLLLWERKYGEQSKEEGN